MCRGKAAQREDDAGVAALQRTNAQRADAAETRWSTLQGPRGGASIPWPRAERWDAAAKRHEEEEEEEENEEEEEEEDERYGRSCLCEGWYQPQY